MASGSQKEDPLGGLGDILSMALEQTGFELETSMSNLLDTDALLNVGGSCNDDPLLSMDIGSLTQGLFSGLSSATLAATLTSITSVQTPASIAETTLISSQQCTNSSKQPLALVKTEPMKPSFNSVELDLDGINLNELISQDPPVSEFFPKNSLAPVSSLSELQGFAQSSLITAVPSLSELLPQVLVSAAGTSVIETAPALAQPLLVAQQQQLDSTDDLSALLDSTGSEYLDSISSVVKTEVGTPSVSRLVTAEELSYTRPTLILKQGSNGGGVVVSQLLPTAKSLVSG